MMLQHLEERDAARRLRHAIEHVYAKGRHLTRDVGGSAGTNEFTDAVIAKFVQAEACSTVAHDPGQPASACTCCAVTQ